MFFFWICLFSGGTSLAVEPSEMLADRAQENRARNLSSQLRCLVCQNQSIDDSNAELARDLRLLVRERISAGDDDAEVKAYLVARYGNFILLNPPVNPNTYLLWGLPFIGFALGLLVLLKRRKATLVLVQEKGLKPEEQAELENLLKADRRSME